MSSAVIELMFSVGPRIVRASGVPTYATSCSRSKTTSSIWLSTSSISRRITCRSFSTAACARRTDIAQVPPFADGAAGRDGCRAQRQRWRAGGGGGGVRPLR